MIGQARVGKQTAGEAEAHTRVGAREQYEKECDEWRGLRAHHESRARRFAGTRAVKGEQRTRQEQPHRSRLNPTRQVLGKEQPAQSEKPAEQHEHLEIARGLHFEQLQRDEDQQDADARLDADQRARHKSDSADAHHEDDELRGEGREARLHPVHPRARHERDEEQRERKQRHMRRERQCCAEHADGDGGEWSAGHRSARGHVASSAKIASVRRHP